MIAMDICISHSLYQIIFIFIEQKIIANKRTKKQVLTMSIVPSDLDDESWPVVMSPYAVERQEKVKADALKQEVRAKAAAEAAAAAVAIALAAAAEQELQAKLVAEAEAVMVAFALAAAAERDLQAKVAAEVELQNAAIASALALEAEMREAVIEAQHSAEQFELEKAAWVSVRAGKQLLVQHSHNKLKAVKVKKFYEGLDFEDEEHDNNLPPNSIHDSATVPEVVDGNLGRIPMSAKEKEEKKRRTAYLSHLYKSSRLFSRRSAWDSAPGLDYGVFEEVPLCPMFEVLWEARFNNERQAKVEELAAKKYRLKVGRRSELSSKHYQYRKIRKYCQNNVILLKRTREASIALGNMTAEAIEHQLIVDSF